MSNATNRVSRKREIKRQTAKRRLFVDDDDDEPKEVATSKLIPTDISSVLETPKKKRRLDDGSQTFFSPKAKAVVTPEKEDEIATPVKRKIPFRREEKKADEAHVPIYIHKNVNYQRRGDASIDEKLKKTFELVESHFFIPEDFERNRSFGPLSGTCFEERAIRAYNLSLLEPKNDADAELEICSHCAVLGHRRSDCPDLI